MTSSTLYIFRLLPFLVLITVISSCSRELPLEDEQAPVIQVLSPVQGMQYSSRDSVEIRVVFTENAQLHETGIWVWEHDTDAYVANFLFHSHDTILDVTRKFFYEASETTILRLDIDATDHNGNVSNKEMLFEVLP